MEEQYEIVHYEENGHDIYGGVRRSVCEIETPLASGVFAC
jgi:hypothetical protein